jgi:DNA polymerase sigma
MDFQDLKPIVLVLKKLLHNSNLNSPYHGGISSYSLVLMTSTFLYTNNAFSMGKNLTEFLNYYGNFFNPLITGLNGEGYMLNLNNADPIMVLDPLNITNNTTRNAFRIQEILQLFKRAHALIITKMKEFKEDK